MNTKKQRLNSLLIIAAVFFSLAACSTKEKKESEVEYEYPPANKFPTIMELIEYENIVLKIELNPETLKFSCTLRNDSPYYWCSVDGQLKNPDPKLPSRVYSLYHAVVAKNDVNNSKELIKKFKKSQSKFYILWTSGPSINKKEDMISNQMFGMYNDRWCMMFFGMEDLCPAGSEIVNIFEK